MLTISELSSPPPGKLTLVPPLTIVSSRTLRNLFVASNTLTGTTGNDILNAPGSVGTEVKGLTGADTITLTLTDDIAQAGAGDDSILIDVDGGAKSSAFGGEGSDTVTLGTAVLTNSVYIRTDGGNDSINLAGGAGFTVNNGAFVAGNAGDDTITATAAITLVTAAVVRVLTSSLLVPAVLPPMSAVVRVRTQSLSLVPSLVPPFLVTKVSIPSVQLV